MRVFQVTAPSRFGGLERVVQSLAAGQQSRGHDVHVVSIVTPGESDTPFHGPLVSSGVDVQVIEVPARAYLRERGAFRDLCVRLRPDVVHTHGNRPDVFDSGVARRLRVPVVSTVHGFFHRGGWRARLTERLHVAALRRLDAVVAVSRALAADLRAKGVPGARLSSIPNAWCESSPPLTRTDARRALGIPEGALVAGCVGRITHQKGLDVALAALGRLGDLRVTLSIVGDGEDRAALETQARAIGVEARVTWHGARTSAHELMRAFDVFVLCSRWEGTPIALLEAMAAGVPVVATDVGGVPDVVSASEALVIPPEDVRALADAIRSVIADPVAAASRARAAQARLRADFGMESWLQRYDSLYQGLLQRPASGRRMT